MENSIWKQVWTTDFLQKIIVNTSVEVLGITFTEIGPDFLKATMPVDQRTIQPYGILHGGATVHLAETLGSVASSMCLEDPLKNQPVGVEINANHLKMVPQGETVTGIVKPIRIGKRLHVWEISVFNSQDALICVSRFTVMIVDKGLGF
jgi:1,4-dihydroxy-2-naphthoyl-CoA hydrolase